MNLAYYLMIAGVVLFAGVFVAQRFWRRAERVRSQPPPVPVNLASTTDAIFLSSGFGRITFANAHAREWFGLDSGDPDLELMAALASPPDVLRDLFAAEGRATFQVGYRRVDAASYLLPDDAGRHMVVILRDMADSPTEYGPETARALIALSRIGQQISANAPLADTLEFILDSLRRAIPYDAGQIVLQAQGTRNLQVLAQLGDFALLRLLTARIEAARKGEGHTGWVVTYGEPLLVEEGDSAEAQAAFESYLGVPLTSGGTFIGVLQVVKAESHAFDYQDLTLLSAIAHQTATAIDRAQLYEDRAQRAHELAGVQGIARATAEMTSRRDLFGALARQVALALDVVQCGILIYDPDGQRLVPEKPFVGVPDPVVEAMHFPLEEGGAVQRAWLRDEGWYANILRDEALIDAVGLRDYVEPLGLRTLALMPMIIGRRRIGMVQVANLQNGEPFGPQDLQRLRVFAAQAAVVVESVRLFERDRDHHQTFEALQAFSQEAGRLPDGAALYRTAAERLAGLLEAEMAGVLEYDRARHLLAAHPAFFGVDPRVQEYIHIALPPGSAFTRLWQEELGWWCNDLERDPTAVEAGLGDLVSWVGIRQALLVPLLVRGQLVGALLAGNKQTGAGFTRQDARLATIFAAQLAVAHENTRLTAEVQAQVTEARGLRQIAEVMGQPLPLDDLLAAVLAQIAMFFGGTLAFVQLLDEATGALNVLPEHVIGATLERPVSAAAYSPGFDQSVVMTGQPLLSNTLAADAPRLPVYQPVIAALGLRQAIIAPLHAGEERWGELVVANRVQGEFGPADIDRLAPIATQLSAALERLRLVGQTDASLRQRAAELSALERVSNMLTQTVEIERILQAIQAEAERVTGADGCTLLMLAPTQEWADAEQPEVMQRYGAVLDAEAPAPIERAALQGARMVTVADYAVADLAPGPAWAGSAVAAPVLYDQRTVGVVHLYSRRAGAFDAGALTFAQALAGKASTAYLNAAQFRDQISRNQLLSRRVEQLNELYTLGQALRAGQDIDALLDAVAHAVHITAGFAVVLVSIYDEEAGGFRRAAQAGVPLATFEALRQVVLSREQVESVLQEEFRIGQSYFLPAERETEWRSALRDGDFGYHDDYVAGETPRRWHPDDALVVPLRDTRGALLGIMSVDAPLDGQRPTRTTLEPLEVFAQQAASGIENFRLVRAIQREADAARRERDVLERLYAVSNDIQRAGDVPTRLRVVTRGIHSAGWRRVHITLRDEDMQPTTLISEGYTPAEEDGLPAQLVPGPELRRWLSDPEFYELRLGTAFYLRHDAPWVVRHLRAGQADLDPVPAGRWHPADQVILPVFGTDTHLIGLISMEEPENGLAPTEATMHPIALFASQAASAIETTRLYQETSRAAEQEVLFNEMMQAVTSTLDVTRIVQAIADGLQRFLPFTRMTVAQYNPATGNLDTVQAAFVRADRLEVQPGQVVLMRDSLLGEVFVQGQGRVMQLGEAPPQAGYADLQRWWMEGQRSLMLVPMLVGGGVVGVMALGSELNRTYGFDVDTMQLVQRVANLGSVAMENARLYQQTAERERFSAALVRLGNELNATLDLSATLHSICRESLAILNVDGAYIWQRGQDELVGIAGVGPGSEAFVGMRQSLAASHALAVRVLEAQEPITASQADAALALTLALPEQVVARAYMGVPLLREGAALGVLILVRTASAQDFTAEEGQRSTIFATQASIAVENARLYQEMIDQTERLGLLNRVSTQLAQSLDMENIFEVALQGSAYALGLAQGRAVYFEAGQPTGRVIVEVPRGDAPPTELIPLEDDPLVAYLRRTLQPLVVRQVATEPLLDALRESLLARGVTSLVMLPLIVGRQVIGMLLLEAPGEPRTFPRDQVEIARTIAGQAAVTIQNANLLEQSYVRTRELETLFEAAQATAMTLDLDEVIQSVAHQVLHALEADSCAVMLWDEIEQDLVVHAHASLQVDAALHPPRGTAYALHEYPLRRRLLVEREAVILRQTEAAHPAEVADMARLGSQTRMLVPLVVRDNAIGLIHVDLLDALRRFSLSEQRIARTLAGQAAIAIENARLNSETAAQVQEAFMINDLSRAVSAAVDLRELFPLVRTQVAALTRSEELYLALYDRVAGVLSFPVALARGEDLTLPDQKLGEDEFSWIINSNRPLLLVGGELSTVRRSLKIRTGLPEAASFLGVPLDLGTQAVGVLAVADRQRSRAFGLNEQRILTTVASQLAVAIQNANLFTELRRFNQQLERRVLAATEEVRAERDRLNVLYTVTAELSATLDLDRVLARALDLLSQAVGAEQGLIMLVDAQQGRLYKRAELGGQVSGPGPEEGLRLGEGLAGWVASHRESVVVEDAQQDPRWLPGAAGRQAPRAALAVLLETSDEVLGVLLFFSTQAGVFNVDHLRLVEAAGNPLTTSINNAALYTYIREQAERLGEMVREQQVEATKNSAVLEGVADGVLFASEQGEVLVFNSAAERVLGIQRGAILGRPISRLKGLFTSGGQRWTEMMERWMADPQAVHAGASFTESAEKDGRVIHLTLAPVTIGGQFLGSVSVLRDITRDVEVDRMKAQFVANVSHELRTPMTSIKGYTDLLVMGAAGEVSARQHVFLDTIKNNADRLGVLVDDMLNISRIDAGEVMMDFQQVDMNHLLGQVVATAQAQARAEERALTLVDKIEPDLPRTYADAGRLAQAFTKLVDNAYRYTPGDGKITVTARREGADELLVAVSDTGIGIPERLLSRVFERFFRNDAHPLVMETPGTGLGLALAKELVEMHGGCISVESTVGQGTTFTVRLPLVTAPPQETVALESGAT